MNNIVEAKNLRKIYNHRTQPLEVLKGINLSIAARDIVSIVGPSGAGKSTLLHVLGGLDRPSDGEVIFDNEKIYSLKDQERSRIRNEKIGFVFQFYHLLAEFTALENVILPGMIKEKTDVRQIKEKGLALLAQVGLTDRTQHKPYQLSGGEQQRVAIARALINEPKVLFCDEPTGNLDSQSGQEIIRLLEKLNRENHQTIVIVTHDERIAVMARTKLKMRDGRIV